MGCCAQAGGDQARAGGGPVVARPKPLKLYGSIQNIQYRTILAAYQKYDMNIHEEHVDPTMNHHKAEKYTIENPSETIPMLEDGFFKILGGSPLIYNFVMKRHQEEIGDKLWP